MFDTFWLLLILPVIAAAVAKLIFRNTLHIIELAGIIVAGALVIGIGLGISYGSQTTDRLILNGQVTDKKRVRTSCAHSYSCRCRTVNKHRSCDTCYHHAYDVDWRVYTTAGTLEISRVDWQGTSEPPRWTSVQLGEPVARESMYTNYVIGAPNSLYAPPKGGETMAAPVPAYPHVHDYYRINRVLTVNAKVPNAKALNDELNNALRQLGPSKQVNVNLVVTTYPFEYGAYLERKWVGGKKNDVTIVVGSSEWPRADWVHVFTFAKSSGNEMLAVELREQLRSPNMFADPKLVADTVAGAISKRFHRKRMEDFKYLMNEMTPSIFAVFMIIIGLVLVCGILIRVFHTNDLDAGGQRRRSFYRRW